MYTLLKIEFTGKIHGVYHSNGMSVYPAASGHQSMCVACHVGLLYQQTHNPKHELFSLSLPDYSTGVGTES